MNDENGEVYETNELKSVLEKVSNKMISVRNIRIAMTFQFWLVVMAGYYILVAPLRNPPIWMTAVYWSFGLIVFIATSRRIWKKIEILTLEKRNVRTDIGITISWIIASILGWFIVPHLIEGNFFQKLAVALLSFISLAVFGMILVLLVTTKKFAKEMVPAVLAPTMIIPLVHLIENPIYFAGMGIVFGYSLTVLMYLYSALKVSENDQGID